MAASALVRLGWLFGALYFLQGLVEPGDGLVAQPTRAMLEESGRGAGAIGDAMLIASLPWAIKPLFGLISDAFPLAGSRRRSYLALSGAVAATALAILASAPVEVGGWLFVGCLAAATAAIAFADVAVDAHMVEVAQPLGLTGPIQAIQWGAIYVAAALAGWAGGAICEAKAYHLSFGAAALGAAATLALALAGVREAPVTTRAGPAGVRAALAELAAALREPRLRSTAIFLVLWSFSPGYGAVLDFHTTRTLGLGEGAYGDATAIHALACAGGCALYWAISRRTPMIALLHAAIGLGAASALVYAAIEGPRSLLWTSALGGATYMVGSLALLDLAARACPPRLAGTLFALLMALQNLSLSVATWLGGHAYEVMVGPLGGRWAYAALALAGAVTSAGCWLLLPAVRRSA